MLAGSEESHEVQNHLYIALDQGYLDRAQFDEVYKQANKTAMIISGLIKYLRANRAKGLRPAGLAKSRQ